MVVLPPEVWLPVCVGMTLERVVVVVVFVVFWATANEPAERARRMEETFMLTVAKT